MVGGSFYRWEILVSSKRIIVEQRAASKARQEWSGAHQLGDIAPGDSQVSRGQVAHVELLWRLGRGSISATIAEAMFHYSRAMISMGLH